MAPRSFPPRFPLATTFAAFVASVVCRFQHLSALGPDSASVRRFVSVLGCQQAPCVVVRFTTAFYDEESGKFALPPGVHLPCLLEMLPPRVVTSRNE